MEERLDGRPWWKALLTWQALMAAFVVFEMLAFCTRHYDPFYGDRLWPQIGMPLTIAFAAVVLAQPGLRKRAGMLWMALYFLWYVAVLILNRWFFAYEYADFRLVLYRLLFTTLVCYPLGSLLADEARKQAARIVFGALTGAFAVLSAVAVFCVVTQTLWHTPYMHGALGLAQEGSTGLRLYLFAHPNISGAALMMTLLLSVYLWLTAKRPAAKAWHALCCLSQFLALALTISRASMVGASAGVGLLPFLWIRGRMRMSRPRLSWLAGAGCALLAAALCYASMSLVVWGTGKIVQTADALSQTAVSGEEGGQPASSSEDSADSPAAPAQRGLTSGLSTVSYRVEMWRAALRAVAASPSLLVKGATLERLMLTVNAQADGRRYVHLHNTYLTVLVGMGLPGLLLMLGFLFLLARCSFRLILCPDRAVSLGERFLPAILLGSLLVGLMEPFYFAGQYFMDRLFYLVAGFIVATACGKVKPKH